MTADRASDFNRFMRLVNIGQTAADCWTWNGSCPGGRHGHFSVGTGKTVKAHRWMYELANGPIPDGLVIRHKCDNPRCVNPIHLEVGTFADNTQDAIQRGRWSDRQGTKHPLARLTEDEVRQIRSMARVGHTHNSLAETFGMSRQYIGKIVRRENWRHI